MSLKRVSSFCVSENIVQKQDQKDKTQKKTVTLSITSKGCLISCIFLHKMRNSNADPILNKLIKKIHCATFTTNTSILNAVKLTGSIRSESYCQNLFIDIECVGGYLHKCETTKEARGTRSFWSCCYRQLL